MAVCTSGKKKINFVFPGNETSKTNNACVDVARQTITDPELRHKGYDTNHTYGKCLHLRTHQTYINMMNKQ